MAIVLDKKLRITRLLSPHYDLSVVTGEGVYLRAAPRAEGIWKYLPKCFRKGALIDHIANTAYCPENMAVELNEILEPEGFTIVVTGD